MSIGKTISLQELRQAFSEIALWKVFLMLFIGLFSVLPMIGYDLILNRMLKQKQTKRYLFETSWVINTLNNIAGFGGFISIGLRSEFYGTQQQGKKVIQALSKIFLFLMAGLSIYSLLAYFIVLFGPVSSYLRQYWVWLIGGGLYFPLVLLLTKIRKKGLIGGFDNQSKRQLILVSFLEWTGVLGSFFAIGALLDIPINIWQMMPLFIAASVIGIASMIPGELGSFDVIMILGLSSFGLSRETIVVWILLYRLFYYIVPFLIGLLLFFKHLGGSLNQKYSGIPKQLFVEIAHKLVVIFLYFSGVMVVLSATIPQAFTEFKWLQHLNPLRFHLVIQFPSILLGFSLLIMGRGMAARVKRAYLPTIILLSIALFYAFFGDFSLFPFLFLLLLLLTVLFSKKELFREQLVYSWESLTVDGLIFGFLILSYIIIGVYNMPSFPHKHHRLISFFLFPSEKVWFSGFLAILAVSLFVILFVRFLQGAAKKIGEPLDETRALQILTTYGGNSDSQLVFLNDKQMYIYNDGQAETVFLQLATINNKCIVMGDPSGKKEDFSKAIEAFIHETDRWGYLPVFYEVHEETVMILHEFGYDFIKMGEEAHVDLVNFTTSGKKMKGARATLNRFEKEGYHFEMLKPPFSEHTMSQLKQVSDEWLGSRKEKGFSLGFFSESYLQKAPIAVVKDKENQFVAFANIMPTYSNEQGTIDLMRHSPHQAPSGSMDYLFLHLFDYMKEQNIQVFNLGMAPLSNVGTSRKSFLQERIAYLVYELGSHFYSFQGLRDYKEKYATEWVARYTLYSRDSWIAYVMIALLMIDNAPIKTKE
ncbi:phosphatidylglycerol lysyltransferase [Enterococcus sp. AZ194]